MANTEELLRQFLSEFMSQLFFVKIKRINKGQDVIFFQENLLNSLEYGRPSESIGISIGKDVLPKSVKGKMLLSVIKPDPTDFINAQLYYAVKKPEYRVVFLQKFVVQGTTEQYGVVSFSKRDQTKAEKPGFEPWWMMILKDTLQEAKTYLKEEQGMLTYDFENGYEKEFKLLLNAENFDASKKKSPSPQKAKSPPKATQTKYDKDTLQKMTVVQLKALAKDKNIKIVGKLKADIVGDIHKALQTDTKTTTFKDLQLLSKNKQVHCKVGDESYLIDN